MTRVGSGAVNVYVYVCSSSFNEKYIFRRVKLLKYCNKKGQKARKV